MNKKNEFDKMLEKAKIIKNLQTINNVILSNSCYHEKEQEKQINKAKKYGKLTKKEEEIIKKIWVLRKNLTEELLNDFEKFTKNIINNE